MCRDVVSGNGNVLLAPRRRLSCNSSRKEFLKIVHNKAGLKRLNGWYWMGILAMSDTLDAVLPAAGTWHMRGKSMPQFGILNEDEIP